MSYLLLNEGFEHLANDEYFQVHSPKERFDNKWFIDIVSCPYKLHFVLQFRQLVYRPFTLTYEPDSIAETIFGVTTSMEVFTPEAVLELLSTLIPLLSRPPFSSSTLEKVAWKYSIHLYLHPGILFETLFFSSAWLPVQGLGEGRWASGEDQPFGS